MWTWTSCFKLFDWICELFDACHTSSKNFNDGIFLGVFLSEIFFYVCMVISAMKLYISLPVSVTLPHFLPCFDK